MYAVWNILWRINSMLLLLKQVSCLRMVYDVSNFISFQSSIMLVYRSYSWHSYFTCVWFFVFYYVSLFSTTYIYWLVLFRWIHLMRTNKSHLVSIHNGSVVRWRPINQLMNTVQYNLRIVLFYVSSVPHCISFIWYITAMCSDDQFTRNVYRSHDIVSVRCTQQYFPTLSRQ